jgi:hypothetical protein
MSESREQPPATGPTFSEDVPAEIRLLIWELAAEAPYIIHFIDLRDGDLGQMPPYKHRICEVSPLFRVCRESRNFVSKHMRISLKYRDIRGKCCTMETKYKMSSNDYVVLMDKTFARSRTYPFTCGADVECDLTHLSRWSESCCHQPLKLLEACLLMRCSSASSSSSAD